MALPGLVWEIREWTTVVDNSHIHNMNIIRDKWPWLDCWKAERKQTKGRKMDTYVLLQRCPLIESW